MSVGTILAVNTSPGGIPKLPVKSARVTVDCVEGDGRDHPKHMTPSRAVLIQDDELLAELRDEGFDVHAGSMGENLTVRDLHVQSMEPGTMLALSGGVVLELTQVREPCYVLDKIDPKLKDVVVGRSGFFAKVVTEGVLAPGETVRTISNQAGQS